MEEKNVKKISLSTVFLILAIITIIVMGVLIFKLNNDKTAAIQKSTELQSKVNNLNETMNNLQEENTLQQTEEVNNLSEIDTLTENYIDKSTSKDNSNKETNSTKNTSTEEVKSTSSSIYSVINKYNSKEYIVDKTKISNYASTMKWKTYVAPGIKFNYPEEFELEEIGGDKRWNRQGEVSTTLTGMAIGINKDTNKIIESSLLINIYEPEFIKEEPSENNRLGYLTTKKGLKWYENNQKSDEDTISIHTCYNTLSDGNIAKYTIEVKTDNRENIKITNIESMLLGSTEFVSY